MPCSVYFVCFLLPSQWGADASSFHDFTVETSSEDVYGVLTDGMDRLPVITSFRTHDAVRGSYLYFQNTGLLHTYILHP